jgi:hypothetical protein
MRRLFVAGDVGNSRGAIEPHFLTRVAMIFFETGMIYTLFVVASLGIYLSGSHLEYVASLAVRPLSLLQTPPPRSDVVVGHPHHRKPD